MSNDPLGIGIIGCGVIAPAHIESFQSCEGVKVMAICDIVRERAEKLAGQYGIPVCVPDVSELLALDTVQAVSVCTGHAEHIKGIEAAVAAGRHVLSEKPLATRREDLERLETLERNYPDLVLEGVLQHRFDASYRFVRETVQQGRAGRLLLVDAHLNCYRPNEYYRSSNWRGTWAMEGGSLLINQAIHFLDLIGWIGGDVRSVMALTDNLAHHDLIETEDTAVLSMRLGSGALGSFHGSTGSHRSWASRFHVVGTEAELLVEDGVFTRIEARDESRAADLRTGASELEEAARLGAVKSHYGSSHPRMIADFVEAIRMGRAPEIPFSEARKAVDLVLAAYESSRAGTAITLG